MCVMSVCIQNCIIVECLDCDVVGVTMVTFLGVEWLR